MIKLQVILVSQSRNLTFGSSLLSHSSHPARKRASPSLVWARFFPCSTPPFPCFERTPRPLTGAGSSGTVFS
jgi:hypothetical protein